MAPFYVLLAQQHSNNGFGLGLLLLASGLANTASAGVWGRLADRSSRQVLAAAGGLAALVSAATAGLHLLALAEHVLTLGYAAAYLLLSVAHSGVRLGRKTYLVDMASADNRATYVALSNTLIGLILLAAGGLISLLSLFTGSPGVILVLSVCALAGGLYALRLPEVE